MTNLRSLRTFFSYAHPCICKTITLIQVHYRRTERFFWFCFLGFLLVCFFTCFSEASSFHQIFLLCLANQAERQNPSTKPLCRDGTQPSNPPRISLLTVAALSCTGNI